MIPNIEDLNNQINKRREGKLKSLFNSQYSFKQAMSVDLQENPDSQMQYCSTNASDIQEKQATGSFIESGSDIFTSFTTTTKFSCYKCHLDIDENTIITPCQHTYHQNCFREQLNKELKKQDFYIRCICSFELNQMVKIKYFQEDKTVYEDIIKFEINNILKFLIKESIIECEGGPYQEQIYDGQFNIIFVEKHCKAIFIFNSQLGINQQYICGFCGRNLQISPQQNSNQNPNTNPKIKLLNWQQQ